MPEANEYVLKIQEVQIKLMTATDRSSLSFFYDWVQILYLWVSPFITQYTNNLSLNCKHIIVNSFMIQEQFGNATISIVNTGLWLIE